ncbi:MAG: DUF3822 family protein [Muribaculaceae bacterium]|nr:DUF3822 family protein [Muribaculaceae bacterium]MDE7369419.1 DUF3822 family protein [Muribaculaceae bacterium]
MTENSSPDILTADMIADPKTYCLDVCIGSIQNPVADFAIYSPDVPNSLIYKSIPLKTDEDSINVEALSEAIYNNPLLLSDFHRISVIVRSSHYMIVPLPLADDSEMIEKLLRDRFSKVNDETAIIVNKLPKLHAAIVFGVEPGVFNLLNRLFDNPPIYSHFYPLLTYFNDLRESGNYEATFFNVTPNALDVVLFKNETNTLDTVRIIPFRSINDAAYYAISYQTMTSGNLQGNILISGSRDTRMQLVNRLKEFVDTVMPVVFPSQIFKLGRVSMTMPFELAVMPLCE